MAAQPLEASREDSDASRGKTWCAGSGAGGPIGAQAVPPAFPAPARVPPALRITPLDSDTCNVYSMFKSLLVTTDRTVTRDRLSNRRSDTRQQPTAAANPPTEAAGGRARGEGGVDSPAARPGSAQGRKAAQEAQRA